MFDICMRVRDIGEIFGSYHKASKNSVYLRNVMINKSASTVALMKVEKKLIISVSRMAIPSFDLFTNEQLKVITSLQNPAYTESARKVQSQRVVKEANNSESSSLHEAIKTFAIADAKDRQVTRPKKGRRDWDQFEANERLFGVKPEFDINDYAADIDRSAPGYKELEEKSLKIAREILSQSTIDMHRLEERGVQRVADVSDDRVYSTVDLEDRWAEFGKEESSAKEVEPVITPQKAAILRELEDVEKIIDDSKGVSDGWTGLVIQILSRKKSLIEKLHALEEEVGSEEPSPSPEAVEKKEPGDTQQPLRRSRGRESSKRSDETGGSGTKGSADEGSKNVSGRGGRQRSAGKKHHDGPKHSETKSLKHVVIGGGALEYASGHECIEAIKHSFRRRRSDEGPGLWGGGSSIADVFSVHMNPLEDFEIPAEKINDITKAVQRDAKASFKKHK